MPAIIQKQTNHATRQPYNMRLTINRPIIAYDCQDATSAPMLFRRRCAACGKRLTGPQEILVGGGDPTTAIGYDPTLITPIVFVAACDAFHADCSEKGERAVSDLQELRAAFSKSRRLISPTNLPSFCTRIRRMRWRMNTSATLFAQSSTVTEITSLVICWLTGSVATLGS